MTRRVLVARLDSLGDVLTAGPAVRSIAASGAEVWFLAGPQGAAAARMLPGVTHVRTWTAPWLTPSARPIDDALIAELRGILDEARPDAAVLLTSFHQSPLPLALLLRLAGVPRIAGASVDSAGGLLDTRLIPGETLPEDLPEPERAVRIAAAAGFPAPAGDDGALAVDGIGAVPAGPFVVVHPGAAVPARAYPAPLHAEVVALLAARGHRVLVTGSAGEAALTAAVAGDAGEDLGGALDLPGLAGVLAGAGALISGNTGPAHLAAAVRTPVVSLFAPVVPAVRWAPYGVPVALLGDQSAPCAGTRATVCPVAGHPCLSSVRPEDVVAAAEGLLA